MSQLSLVSNQETGSTAARTDGFADVWMRGHFAWEYKAPGKSLEGALRQLMVYALPLENPPLLIVSDRLRIEVHTHFTGTPSERHVFALEELVSGEVRAKLRAIWENPDAFKPRRTNRDITEEAALTFAETAERLRSAGVPGEQVSHFLTQCLFCFFAEDVGLLPSRLFERLVGVRVTPERMRKQLGALFETMRVGGMFGVDDIPWFNGGLFSTVDVPPLTAEDVIALQTASSLDWSAIDPSIFGTLFERGLDPSKRSSLGAHYTDPATIERLIDPVVRSPLREEWGQHRSRIETSIARSKKHGDRAWRDAEASFATYLERLRNFRLLDPACGSGNFLYLGLKALKDLEHEVNLDAESLGLQRQNDVTGPHNVLGIELNEYAAELARVTVWIGELQWRIQHGYGFNTAPVLQALDHIECRDALLNEASQIADWPAAEVVIGNPPFIGDKKMRKELGSDYTDTLRATWRGRVPGGADLVCYWFEKARGQIENGALQRAGLVTTNSIRGGRNREVLDRICESSRIFEAWSDEPWINNGAAVRVSLVAFGNSTQEPVLDGERVPYISSDLTACADAAEEALDLTQAVQLPENADTAYAGIQKTGPFELPGDLARNWLRHPNPNSRPNSDVLKPWFNGLDVTRRNRDMWIVDFGADMPKDDASLYETPFAHVTEHVKPTRVGKREARTNERYWLFQWSRPQMRRAIAGLSRFIVTPEVSKHRVFTWLSSSVVADKNLIVIARTDDAILGVLHSRFHELWSLRLGTSLEDRPRYTSTSTFETFPFPEGLTPSNTADQRTLALTSGAVIPAGLSREVRKHAEAIAVAASRLHALREKWLNPPEWTQRRPEVVPLGLKKSPFPERIVAREGFEAELAKRTLTNLYNLMPAWLTQAHEALDQAVATAYGWDDYTPDLADEEVLSRLLALNLERAAAEETEAAS